MSSSPQRTRRKILTADLVSLVFRVMTVMAASTAQEMYLAATAREEAVRASACAKRRRRTCRRRCASRRRGLPEIVRLYPASGYSDNALWQAGRLSIDAFLRFGQERDRISGVRLLRQLTTGGTRSSRQIQEVPDQLARLDGAPSDGSRSPAGTGVQPAPKAGVATIKNIRREVLSDAVRITIELDHEVAFHDERIPDPVRVFVDLPLTRLGRAPDKTLRFDGDNGIVRQIRIGRHPNATTRVVLEAGLAYRSFTACTCFVKSVSARHRLRPAARTGAGLRGGAGLAEKDSSAAKRPPPLPASPIGTVREPLPAPSMPTAPPAFVSTPGSKPPAPATPAPLPSTDALRRSRRRVSRPGMSVAATQWRASSAWACHAS